MRNSKWYKHWIRTTYTLTLIHTHSLKNKCMHLCVCFQICLHDGPAIDPDARDDVDSSWVEKDTLEYVRRHFMGVEPKISIAEHCIYTVSVGGGDYFLSPKSLNSDLFLN